MKYADVLLPLPLYSTYTYMIEEEQEPVIRVGSRVLVQFGAKKYYTGIVELVHNKEPKGFEVKSIMTVLDPDPIVVHPQLKFWRWISEYYLCSPGEVYKAAVPTGLKPESETFVSLNPDFVTNNPINEQQALIVGMLQHSKHMKIGELDKELKSNCLAPSVNSLIKSGMISVYEKVQERYHSKTESFVKLLSDREQRNGLRTVFEKIGKSSKQEKVLMSFLELSGWMRPNEELKDVTKELLLQTSECDYCHLKKMIDKGIFSIEKRKINKFTSYSVKDKGSMASLSGAQQVALDEIVNSFKSYNISLLHGLTGSGKTEVYTHLISSAIKEGKQTLYLVPEISLTTQLTDRLRVTFGDNLLIYHSKFTDAERVEIWNKLLHSRNPYVVLGVRSSVFLPFANLGLIVVDEEHESSYKQMDPAPRYNARDAAIVLASMHGAKVLLGSATPSVETFYKAQSGKYGLITLSERFNGAKLPEVQVVDMKDQRKRKINKGTLSEPLVSKITDAFKEGKQAILFQNRRGFAPVVVCRKCGWTPKCHNCDVALTYHKNDNSLSCHYCGFKMSLPKFCPACGENSVEIFGYGTERVEDEIANIFPGYKISRMDLDTTRNKNSYQNLIEEFASHKTDMLVGTQMISKGLDFNDVEVVGVVNADTILNFPDFRSNERAFNMLEQVAGRAGRRNDKGKVIIQSTQPDNPILKYVCHHDYLSFYKDELEQRRKFNYPPYSRIVNIYIKNKDSAKADVGAVKFVNALKQYFGNRVLGPEKPFVSRVATWYIQSIMLKIEYGASMKKVKDLLRYIHSTIADEAEIKSSVIYYDVDPM